MKKTINMICIAFGFLFLGIGVVGIAMPVLPTTPFFLLAAALFAKGSERFYNYFISTGIYKKYIKSTIEKKEMTKNAKRKALLIITLLFSIGFLTVPFWHAKVLIIVVLVFHYYYFLIRIKSISEKENQDDPKEGEKEHV